MVQIVYDYGRTTKRNEPVSPKLKAVLDRAAAAAGVTKIVVYSGGQSSTSRGKVGSSRHDHGGAGDMRLYVGDRKLDFNTDRGAFQTFVSAARAAGATGIGAAEDYMGVDAIHVGFGKPVVWGAGGKSANAPQWLRDAYNDGASGSFAFAEKPADPTVAAMNPIGGRILRKGSRGEDVRTLQAYLTENGYDTRGIDGVFGRNTERAVRRFQQANQLKADGIVGNQTRAPIAADLAPFSEPAIPRTNGFPATTAAQLPVADPTQATRKSLGEHWESLRQLGQEPPMYVNKPDFYSQSLDAMDAMDRLKPATIGQTVDNVDFTGRFDPSGFGTEWQPVPENMHDRPIDRSYIQRFLDPNRTVPSMGLTIGDSYPIPEDNYLAGASSPPVEGVGGESAVDISGSTLADPTVFTPTEVNIPLPKPRPTIIGQSYPPPQVQAAPKEDILANASTPELLDNLGASGKTLKSIGDLLGGGSSGILRGGTRPSLGSTIGAMAAGTSLDKGNSGSVDRNNKFSLSDFSGRSPDFNPVSGGSKYNTYKGVNDKGQTVHYYTTDTGRTFVTSVEG